MKAIKFFVTMMLFGITMGMTAQVSITALESKFSEKTLKQILKQAKKQAKDYKKQGWEVGPGGLPMEMQLYRSYLMDRDASRIDMQSNFAFGEDQSTGQFYSAAKTQASEFAKTDLVGKLHTEITRNVEAEIINQQLNATQAESVAGINEKSMSITVQRLHGLDAVLELHRSLKNGNVEVMIRYAYSRDKAKDDTYEFINAECEKMGLDFRMKTGFDMVQ